MPAREIGVHLRRSSFSKKPFLVLTLSVFVVALAVTTKLWPRLSLFAQHFRIIHAPLFTAAKMSQYDKELQVAELAVQRAAILTKTVFHEKAKGTLSKDDKSPVTIGDFGAQALIINAIAQNFPEDEVVGEEESNSLRGNAELRNEIWALVKSTKLDNPLAETVLGGPIENMDAMLEAIDKGKSIGGNKGRVWALDPIDGTKGFLRGGQYAVCLALIVDGQVRVGVLGCPNLPTDDSVALSVDIGANSTDIEGFGVLFSAAEGRGATSRPLSEAGLLKSMSISMKPIKDIAEATFCESVEAGHSSHGDQAAIAKRLGIIKPSVRMDSQAKYGSIARGAGDIYLRLPVSGTYVEKIWDHAAGDLIVREAGGIVTDIQGKRLDFSKGRTLVDNKGIVAASSSVHAQVLEAVEEVLARK